MGQGGGMKIRLYDGIIVDTRNHKYMGADVDRHGNARVFVRRHGRKIRIRDWSSVEVFMGEYKVLLAGPMPVPAKHTAAAPRSMRWLVERYYGSAAFVMLEDSTRKVRRRLLDRFCEQHGTKPYDPLRQPSPQSPAETLRRRLGFRLFHSVRQRARLAR